MPYGIALFSALSYLILHLSMPTCCLIMQGAHIVSHGRWSAAQPGYTELTLFVPYNIWHHYYHHIVIVISVTMKAAVPIMEKRVYKSLQRWRSKLFWSNVFVVEMVHYHANLDKVITITTWNWYLESWSIAISYHHSMILNLLVYHFTFSFLSI